MSASDARQPYLNLLSQRSNRRRFTLSPLAGRVALVAIAVTSWLMAAGAVALLMGFRPDLRGLP